MLTSPTKVVEIPMPPSGNHMYDERVLRTKARGYVNVKFPTEDYKSWLDTVSQILLSNFPDLEPPLICKVNVFGGSGFVESRDWDNLLKCLGDSFTQHEFQDKALPKKAKRLYGSGILANDSIRYLKGWQTLYYTEDEHRHLLPIEARPGDKARLGSKCMIQFLPAPTIIPPKPEQATLLGSGV